MSNTNKIDYKNIDALKPFLTPRGRIQSRKRAKVNAKTQRSLAMAIKRARFMALLPYTSK